MPFGKVSPALMPTMFIIFNTFTIFITFDTFLVRPRKRPKVGHGQGGERGRILLGLDRALSPSRQEAPVEVMIVVPLVVPDQPLAVSELEGRVQDWGSS